MRKLRLCSRYTVKHNTKRERHAPGCPTIIFIKKQQHSTTTTTFYYVLPRRCVLCTRWLNSISERGSSASRGIFFFSSSPRRWLPQSQSARPGASGHLTSWSSDGPRELLRAPENAKEEPRHLFFPPLLDRSRLGAPQRRPGAAKKRPREPREAQKRRRGVKKWSQRSSKGSPREGPNDPQSDSRET